MRVRHTRSGSHDALRASAARFVREEVLKPLGVTQSELALRLGVSFPRVNEVIRGKRAMTPDTALRLARVLGMSAEFWLGLQLDWDLWHAMRGSKAAEISELAPLRTPA